MRFVPRQNMICERGREWISLRLDGELSELAEKMLESHLARCAGCRAFEADIVGTTGLIRSAPLEQLEQPLSLPRGRRLLLTTRRISATAAATAVIVLGVGAFLNMPSGGSNANGPSLHVVATDNSDITQQRGVRATMLRPDALRQELDRGPTSS
jgi:predicted anti-sigma-YlaC factor YlaD